MSDTKIASAELWEKELWAYLLPPKGEYAGDVERLWKGRRFLLQGECWLADPDEVPHFFELHILAPVTAGEAASTGESPE